MKIILKSKIKKLGNIGDIVDVKDGYGRNMLIPNNLAIFYTDKNYEVFQVKKVEIEKENEEKKIEADMLKEKINSKDLILIENAGDDGKLYGSITTIKLAQAVNSMLKINTLTKNNVFLKESLKNIGKYAIIIELHPEVSFEKDVIIARSKDEANKIKKGEIENKKKESSNIPLETNELNLANPEGENKEKKEKKSSKKEENSEKFDDIEEKIEELEVKETKKNKKIEETDKDKKDKKKTKK